MILQSVTPLALKRNCTTYIVNQQVIQVIQMNQKQKARPVTVKRRVMKRVMLSVLKFWGEGVLPYN